MKQKLLDDEGYEGYVEENVMGGPSRIAGYVMGDTVFRPMFGGPDQVMGHVKNGVAYEMVFGGPNRPIGRVKYYSNKRLKGGKRQ